MLYPARKSDVNEGSLCHDDNLKRDPWSWLSKYSRKCISLCFSSVVDPYLLIFLLKKPLTFLTIILAPMCAMFC